MFFAFLPAPRLVISYLGGLLPFRPPGKLLNAVRRLGNLAGFAAGHGEYEDLRLRVFSGSIRSDKRQSVAVRRPARRADTLAFVGQDMLRSRGDINQTQSPIPPSLLEIWPK